MGCPTAPVQSHHQQGHHRGQILPIQPRALPLVGLETGDRKVPVLPAARYLPGRIPLADPKSPWGTAQRFWADSSSPGRDTRPVTILQDSPAHRD